MRLLVCTLFAATTGLFLAPSWASACSCAQPPPAAAALEAAGIVFEGTVTTVPGPPAPGALGGMGKHEYRFSVARSWKGTPGMELRVLTNASSAACGRVYEQGATYLIYGAMDEEANVYDTLCSRTRTIAAAAEDLVVLGAGQLPRARAGAGRGSAAMEGGVGAPPEQAAGTSEGGAASHPAAPTPEGTAAEPLATVEPNAEAEAPVDPEVTAAAPVAPAVAPQDDPKEGCSHAPRGPRTALTLLLLPALARARRRR